MRRLTILLLVLYANLAHAVTVQIDYSTDSGDFFLNNAVAKATLEKAAADIGAAITSNLGAISTGAFSGTSGQKTSTITWSFDLESPSTGLPVPIANFAMPANVFRVYVGSAALGGPLGIGGPIGYGFEVSGSGGASGTFGAAYANAASSSNAVLSRGAGPVILSADQEFDGVTRTLSVGAIAGTLSIDNTTSWHFDYNTPVQPGEFDLYSVALHEMLHSLGFGTADTWDGLIDESGHWLGTNVFSLTGTNDVLNILDTEGHIDLAHIKDGLQSISIVTGEETETVMDPTLLIGTRKTLTELDLAFLRDIGFDTIAVPEPSAIALGALAVFAFGAARYARRRAA